MAEDVTISRERAEQIATALNPFAKAAELGYGTLLPESVIEIESWVAAGCPTPTPGPDRPE